MSELTRKELEPFKGMTLSEPFDGDEDGSVLYSDGDAALLVHDNPGEGYHGIGKTIVRFYDAYEAQRLKIEEL